MSWSSVFSRASLVAALVLVGGACQRREEAPPRSDQPGAVDTTREVTPTEPMAREPGARDEEVQPVAGREGDQLMVRSEEGKDQPITDEATIRKIETKLQAEGLDVGEADGKVDTQLKSAITQFQMKQGLPSTGHIDRQTAQALGLDWKQLQMGGGVQPQPEPEQQQREGQRPDEQMRPVPEDQPRRTPQDQPGQTLQPQPEP